MLRIYSSNISLVGTLIAEGVALEVISVKVDSVSCL